MRNLEITDIPFIKEHKPADLILKMTDKTDCRQYTDVLVKCKESAKAQVIEYFNGTIIGESANGYTLMKLTVVENEQSWIGRLLSLGDNVEIISPERIRNRVIEAATKILTLYNKVDKSTSTS